MNAVRMHTLGSPEVLRSEEVLDPQVGEGQVLTKSLTCLAPMGRLVIYGRASGTLPMLDPVRS